MAARSIVSSYNHEAKPQNPWIFGAIHRLRSRASSSFPDPPSNPPASQPISFFIIPRAPKGTMVSQQHDAELPHNSTDELPRLSMDEALVVAPVVQQTVRDVLKEGHEYSSRMFEAQPMCDHVLERFEAITSHSATVNPAPPPAAVDRYNALLTQYVAFLKRFVDEKAVFRLVHNRIVIRECLQFHDDIDTLLNGFKFPPGIEVLEQWRPRWKTLRDAQYVVFEEMSRNKLLLLHKVDQQDTHTHTQALALLLYEYSRVNSGYTIAELQLLLNAFNVVTRFSKNTAPRNESWFLPPYEVKISTAFAWGSYGKVHNGKFAGSDVAVKVMNLPEKNMRAQFVARFVKEANIWFSASKIPNVVRLFGAYYNVDEPYFVSEFATNGTLRSYLQKEVGVNQTWKLLHQVANGVLALHKLGILHNDLKCDNVLVGADGVAKITDFGLCCTVTSLPSDATEEETELRLSQQKGVGAVPWKAPEILSKRSDPSFASDIYSLGMCIVEAVTLELPWGKMDPSMIRRSVIKGKLLPRPASGFDTDQWTLVERMCAEDPSKRISMNEVVELLYGFKVREGKKKQLQRRASIGQLLATVPEATCDEEGTEESAPRSTDLIQRLLPVRLGISDSDAPLLENSTASADTATKEDVSVIEPAIEVDVASIPSSPPDNLVVASSVVDSEYLRCPPPCVSAKCTPLKTLGFPAQGSSSHATSSLTTSDPEIPQPPALIPVVVSHSSVQSRDVEPPHPANACAPPSEPDEEPKPEPKPVIVNAVIVKSSRYVTLEGNKKQIVQYQVVIQLTNGKEVTVWKRFSAFRNFCRHIRQQNCTKTDKLVSFPSRFTISGSMSAVTVSDRTKSLHNFMNSVIDAEDVSFGVLVSENEWFANQLVSEGSSVVLL